MAQYFNALLALCFDMAPYLLLGFILAGLLKVFLPANFLAKHMGAKNALAPVNAALLGVPLPLCSCGVLPAGLSLHKNGAGKGAAVSFLISTPQTGLDSILVTYAMMGLPFAIIRPIVAFVTGVTGGIITSKFDKESYDKIQEECAVRSKPSLKAFIHYTFEEFLMDISKWLIIGLLIAALVDVIMPVDFFSGSIAKGPLAMLIVLLGSVPLYVCATASIPIALVLMSKGLSAGAALVFLMAGPATNAATITVLKQTLGTRTMWTYLLSIVGGAIGFGLFIDYVLPAEWFSIGMTHAHHNHNEMLPFWLSAGSAIVLLVALLRGYGLKLIKILKRIKSKRNKNMEKEFTVEGMGCAMCTGKVEDTLMKMDKIEFVKADFKNNTVVVQGDAVDSSVIEETINGLGYSYKGEK